MNLQVRYGVLMAEREAAENLAKIVPFARRAGASPTHGGERASMTGMAKTASAIDEL
jgi:hypothetical protein